MQSKTPVYGYTPYEFLLIFYNLVLTLSNGKDKNAQATPDIAEDINLVLSSFLSYPNFVK